MKYWTRRDKQFALRCFSDASPAFSRGRHPELSLCNTYLCPQLPPRAFHASKSAKRFFLANGFLLGHSTTKAIYVDSVAR